ncbi:hypothetical protein [Mycobacteroides abscessus]|uniref:hypothetical protein n=1 Tax=Mycobacteroides abscessus TaxID=36809 RepID=UPI00139021C1|nr:hypothetical protein [Mycobacteroides abscessus]
MTSSSYTFNDGRQPPLRIDPRLAAVLEAATKEHDEAMQRAADKRCFRRQSD